MKKEQTFVLFLSWVLFLGFFVYIAYNQDAYHEDPDLTLKNTISDQELKNIEIYGIKN